MVVYLFLGSFCPPEAVVYSPGAVFYTSHGLTMEEWTEIGRDLGGLNLRHVKANTMKYVQEDMEPIARAAFWTAVGVRQRPIEHKRSMQFPSGFR